MAVKRYRHRPTGGYSCSCWGVRPSGVKVSAEQRGSLSLSTSAAGFPQARTRSRLPLPIGGRGDEGAEANVFGTCVARTTFDYARLHFTGAALAEESTTTVEP